MVRLPRIRMSPRTAEERSVIARSAIRRAVWYIALLAVLLTLIWKPDLIVRFIH